MFTRRRSQTPPAQPTLRAQADAARDARDWRLAAALYEMHLAAPPHDADAPLWVQLGHSRKEAGDLDGARRAYDRSLDLDPGQADTHLQVGHLHKLAGRPGPAAASYAEALRRDPDCADARAELAALGRGGDASPPVPAGPAPDDLARADEARDAGRWSEAARLYAAFLAAQPAAAGARAAWVQLGHASKEAGDRDGAVLAYETALGLDPADAETHVHLGHLHKAMGATAAAVDALFAALRLAPHLDDVERDLQALVASTPTPTVRRSPAAQRGAVRHAFPLPWTGDRSLHQAAFPSIHAGLSRRFESHHDADAP